MNRNLAKLIWFVVAVLSLSTSVFATQTIFLDHSDPLCINGSPGAVMLGTWFNAAHCSRDTTFDAPSGSHCFDNETADRLLRCISGSCCCFQAYIDNDSRTIDDNCDLSSISAQTHLGGFCD